jgi:hypothetical protein
MTSTEPLNPGNAYGPTTEEVLNGQVLSSETLMLYITMKLDEVDGTFNELLGVQKKQLAKQEYLNEVDHYVQQVKELHDNYDGDYEQWHDYRISHLGDIPQPPPGLEDLGATVNNEWAKTIAPTMDKDERSGQIDIFKSRMEQLSGEVSGKSQLMMMQLQQAMADRKSAIDLTTNLMAGVNDCNDAICQNCR